MSQSYKKKRGVEKHRVLCVCEAALRLCVLGVAAAGAAAFGAPCVKLPSFVALRVNSVVLRTTI